MNNNYNNDSCAINPDNLNIIINLCKLMNSAIQYDPLLEKIMSYCTDVMDVEGASILLYDDKADKLIFHLSTGDKSDKLKKIILAPDEGIAGWVFQHNEPVLCNDLANDPRFSVRIDKSVDYITNSMIAVPLCYENKVIGVMELVNKNSGNGFNIQDLILCEGIAAHISLALERIRLISENIANSRLAAIGETVAGLAHYIKNVLTALEGSAHLISSTISDDCCDKAIFSKCWPIVDRNINTISSLVLDMLEFSKDREPDYAKNNINTLITQIAELYREKAQSAGITFDISLDSSIPEFYFDSTGIHRCILNLLSNSFDAVNNTDNPIIKLAVHNNSNQETIITVTDNGYGMTQEIIDKIMMSNFFSTKGSKGTGLGLPITRKIIHEHNGTLNITSTPGEGTTFTISIPVIFHNPLNE